MFTDTKNLTNSGINSKACNVKSNIKSKGKLRHFWRLITLRTDSKRPRSGAAITHPNNVNLNNTNNNNNNNEINDHGEAIHELTAAQLEDYVSSVQKMTSKTVDISTAEQLIQSKSVESIDEFINVISSASIEKCPATTFNCIYGRNCQHNHKTMGYCDEITPQSCLPIIEFPSDSDLLEQIPLQYLHTDDGSFFWTLSQDRTDDDLLNAWLCHSLQQLPTQAAQLC